MKKIICEECYSDNSRITPLIRPIECLKNHKQYICGTCKRLICIDENKKGLRRFNFPFKTLETAKLYLKVAEYINKTNCEIYELKKDNNRIFFKIFKDKEELNKYLKKNQLIYSKLVFKNFYYKEYKNTLIKRLNDEEIQKYMSERK